MTNVKLCIIIPALREQKEISKTLYHFSKINYNAIDLKIVVVTTERENFEPSIYKETTAKIVDITINKLNSKLMEPMFYRMHYPRKDGKRAHQINYALENIHTIFPNCNDVIIGFYDADSRPDTNTFQSLVRAIKENPNIQCYQQLSLFFDNYNEFKHSYWLTGAACFQTYFTLKKELPRLVNGEKNKHPPVCGHGFFITLSLINSLGRWPTDVWCEDLVFSIKLLENNIKVGYLPTFEHCQTPSKVSMYIKQSAAWFTTAMELKRYNTTHKITRQVFIHRNLLNIQWSSLPITWLTVILVGMYFYKIIGISLLLLWCIYQFHASYLVYNTLRKNNYRVPFFKIYTSTILFFWVSHLGPWLAIRNKIFTKITGKKFSHPKTER
jgi:cellulose synthase/poly-beta-1,6-N-acetylglucosamine synthase-like glycosyltransferase